MVVGSYMYLDISYYMYLTFNWTVYEVYPGNLPYHT